MKRDRTLTLDTPRWALPLLEPARYKGAHGGRGGGKSEFFAGRIVEEMVANKDYSVLCVREIQSSLANSVKRTIELAIKSAGVEDLFDMHRDQIRRRGGSGIVTFVGMRDHTADTIKSYSNYDVAFVEEAQALSQHSLDLLRPTIRKPGSEIWFAWNPRRATDPVDRFLRAERPEGGVVAEVNYWDNPWFPNELKREMEHDKSHDIDRYHHVWCGKYEQRTARAVFRNWKVQPCEPGPQAHLRYGIDFGFTNDPSAAVRCWIEGRTLYVDYEACDVGIEIADLPAFFLQVPDIENWPSVADSSRPETISHLRKNGLPKIFAAVKGTRSVEEGIGFLQGFTIVIDPRCTNVIRELGNYCYCADEAGRPLPKLEDKDNHLIDALRYACEGARRAEAAATRAKPAAMVAPPSLNFWNNKSI
jgi:phage terminase large subunit